MPAGIAHSRDQTRAKVATALGEDSRDVRELQRRDQEVALPDAHVDGLAGKPRLVFRAFERPALPLRARTLPAEAPPFAQFRAYCRLLVGVVSK